MELGTIVLFKKGFTMSYVSADEVVKGIEKQEFTPETLVYSNTRYGRVWVHIVNLTADRNDMINVEFRVEVFDREIEKFQPDMHPYATLHDALKAIGLPSID